MNKLCKCGKEYEVPKHRVNSKYCSMECQRKYREYGQNSFGSITKKCPCGKEYTIPLHKAKQKTCSSKCSRKYRDYSNMKRSSIMKICKCGKEFRVYPYRKDVALYCSLVCKGKFQYHPSGYKSLKGSLAKMGDKNPQYGKIKENPTRDALHSYIHKRLDPTKPKLCQHCGEERLLQMANKSQQYKRDLDDWLWLCVKCHQAYDGTLKYLELGRVRGPRIEKKCLMCPTIIKDITPSKQDRKKCCSRRCVGLYTAQIIKNKIK